MRKEIKIFSAIFICLAALIGSASALTIGTSTPLNDSVVKGTAIDLFGIQTDAAIGVIYINGFGTNLNCNGTYCQVNRDDSMVIDHSQHGFFFVLNSIFYPAFGTTFQFRISRDPAKITGIAASSISDTSIGLSWNAGESDVVYYSVFRDGVSVANITATSYTDTGLITGQNYTYQVDATDSDGNIGMKSDAVIGVAMDTTPPADPAISGNIANTTPIATHIDYAEPVSLKIVFGQLVIQDMGTGQNFVFTTNPVSHGTRFYQSYGCDNYNNCRTTNFSVTYQGNPVVINATTSSVPFWSVPVITPIISDASIEQAGGYWLFQFNLSYYRYCNIRPAMSDILGNSGAFMLVNEEIQPATSCDQSALFLDYYLDNTQDLLQASLDGTCVDLDPSGFVKKSIYIKYPLKSGIPADTWSWTTDWFGDVC